jgi:uncharacterized protein (DUF1697 family)
MTRYLLLIRGINVGTKNSLPMAELRSMLEKLGCVDVQTYIQSGNAVFASKRKRAELNELIEERLSAHMKRPIAATLRTLKEFSSVIERKPFADIASNPSFLCVSFFSHTPSNAELKPLTDQDFGDEQYEVVGKELYSWHPRGQGKSALAATLSRLKVRGALTTRNWNTVLKLEALLREADFEK